MRHFRAILYAGTIFTAAIAQTAIAQDIPADPAGSQARAQESVDAVAAGEPEHADDGSIIVTGYQASLRSARAAKQASDAIIDTVVAEDLGQLPDNSAVEALARLPGVQIFRNRGEGQSITFRGLTQVLTTLDGAESYIGSSRRSLLTSYPAGLLKSITVYKALTPDLIEGGIAGAVDVRLRQPFDFREGLVVAGTVRGSYDDQSRKGFYNGDLLVSNRWNTGIGEIGLLLNASYLRRDYFETYRENFAPPKDTGAPGQVRFPNTILVKQPNGYYKRPVFSGMLQWRPDSNLRMDLRVTHIDDTNVNYDADLTSAIAANTVLSNVTMVPGTNLVKSATFTLPANSVGPRSSHAETHTRTTQAQFGVEYVAGRATLSSNLVYIRSRQSVEQQLFQLAFRNAQTVTAQFQSDSKFGGPAYGFGTTDLTDPANFYARAYSDALTKSKGSGLQWRGDLELEAGDGPIKLLKTGFRYARRTTDFQSGTRLANLAALRLPLSSFPGGTDTEVLNDGFHGDDVAVPSSWVQYRGSLLGDKANRDALNAYVATLAGQSAFASERPAFTPTLAFDGAEKSYAAYAQVKYGFDLGGDVTVDGVVGARVVNTVLAINGTQSNARVGQVTTFRPINGRQNYLDVDPSVSAVVHFGRNVQLRGSWTKTFSRPDFSQLNPSLVLAESAAGAVSTATAGNPDLRPIRSTNWDASLEWYFGRAGSLSAALFRRDVNGFIVNTVSREPVDGAVAGLTDVTRPINAGDGTIKGFELSATTFVDFAPGILRNFGASANFTYIDTNQVLPATPANTAFEGPIAGISKRSFNTALFYDDGRFRARVAYSWRSRFVLSYVLADPDNNLNWYPISRLDASTAYKVTDNVTITIDGQNLLGKPQRSFWGNRKLEDNSYDDRVYFEGRVYSAAVRFKF